MDTDGEAVSQKSYGSPPRLKATESGLRVSDGDIATFATLKARIVDIVGAVKALTARRSQRAVAEVSDDED